MDARQSKALAILSQTHYAQSYQLLLGSVTKSRTRKCRQYRMVHLGQGVQV